MNALSHPTRAAVAALLSLCAGAQALAAPQCSAQSAATATPVIELYTSEGCNSCPPADRWLSQRAAEPGVVALAFHVDYWDRLGWRDRFGSAAFTQRQTQQQAFNGARFIYTPQVVFDGRDRKDWPALSAPALQGSRPAARVAIELMRDGERYRAVVRPHPGSPVRLAAYWAVTEDGHASAVRAGENAGVTLHHDRVVRDYLPVAAWTATDAATELRFAPSQPAGDTAHPRRVNLVITDAASGLPVQAVTLGC